METRKSQARETAAARALTLIRRMEFGYAAALLALLGEAGFDVSAMRAYLTRVLSAFTTQLAFGTLALPQNQGLASVGG